MPLLDNLICHVKLIAMQPGENQLQMCQMTFTRVAVNMQFVEINSQEYVNGIPNYVIHKRLECSRRVVEPRRQDKELLMSVFCLEGGLFYVFIFNADLVKSFFEVQFRVDRGLSQSV